MKDKSYRLGEGERAAAIQSAATARASLARRVHRGRERHTAQVRLLPAIPVRRAACFDPFETCCRAVIGQQEAVEPCRPWRSYAVIGLWNSLG